MALTFRPIAGPDELDLFLSLPYTLNDEIPDDLAGGRRRTGWMWVALDEGRLVARVAWWSRAGAAEPHLMDILDFVVGGDAAAEELVRTALAAVGGTPPEYMRFVPAGWRDDPGDVEARMAVLGRLGARPLVERRNMEWRRGAPLPAGSGRLKFRSFGGTGEALALLTAALEGTLDAHSRADLRRHAAGDVAAAHLHGELARYPSPRDWWRVATLPGGDPVGFVFPARNDYGLIIAYIGVLPGHRGRGYIDDVLAEGTRVLAAQPPGAAPRIRATTDVTNVPMAEAFLRAGYVNYRNEVTMVW
ncbi:GNAT family N-acetyltransferase [Dactylosporangium sp. CA-092794]|uniref:GNAT family N-acetyltransferase n=1 Tax=Dactylosporangium sp. CA-092794 TaxID=3239929 RepID=UPI003D8AC9B4